MKITAVDCNLNSIILELRETQYLDKKDDVFLISGRKNLLYPNLSFGIRRYQGHGARLHRCLRGC